MKNIYYASTLVIFLCLAFFTNAKTLACESKASIEDELLKNTLSKSQAKISIKKAHPPITDELLNPNLYKNTPFRLSAYVNKHANQPIEDELLKDNNFKSILKNVKRINPKNKYDFTKKQIPIRIKIAQQLKSTRQIIEGSTIPFVADHDFEINNKKYKRGTTILGRVETISASDKMGTPESIKISNFYIPDSQEIDLYGSISKNGANRSIWVYPLYQAGNILLYAAGFAVVPIHGGRAKLSASESFTVFYETQ